MNTLVSSSVEEKPCGVFNSTNSALVFGSSDEESLRMAISSLTNLPSSFSGKLDRGEIKAWQQFESLELFARIIIDEKERGNCVLSPRYFSYANPNRIPPQIVNIFLEESRLGQSVVSALDELGVFDEIMKGVKTKDQRTLRLRIYRTHVAAFVMSVTNVRSFEEIDRNLVYDWLSHYYNFAKFSFLREDLFPSSLEYHKKTFKRFATVLGAYFNDAPIVRMGAVHRIDKNTLTETRALLESPPPNLKKWVELWQQWRSEKSPRSKSPIGAFRFLVGYLLKYDDICADPTEFLRTQRSLSLLQSYTQDRVAMKRKEVTGGEEFALLRQFSDFICDELFHVYGVSAPFALVTKKDDLAHNKLRTSAGVAKKKPEADANPLPVHYYDLLREILEEGEHGWPGRHRLCRALIRGKLRYVPVLPTLYLTLFDIPLRTVQVRRLDSGEGDVDRFNGLTLCWERNTGPCAGHWKEQAETADIRGYAARTDNPKITGFFINTNKHSAAWIIPWQNAELHRRLFELRLWQEKWNPVIGPVQLKYDGDPEEGANDRLPEVFPLFRMPAGASGSRIEPLTYRQCIAFWTDLMLEVQTRWNASVPPEDQDFFVTMDEKGKNPVKSTYTSHGMRVAGITIMLQNGLPIEIVSKCFAGHATILQTGYYAKFQADYVQKKFEQINIREDVRQRALLFRDAKNLSVEEAERRLFGGASDAIAAAYQNVGTWERRDIGICPFNGQKCGSGSPEGKMVEGGRGNCVLCRHFVTGPEYGLGLWSYANHLLYRLSRMNVRIMALTSEIESLEDQLSDLDKDSLEYSETNATKRTIETVRNNVIADQVPISRSFAKCVQISEQLEAMEAKADGDQAIPLRLASEHSTLDFLETSAVEQAIVLAENAQVFKSTYDPEVEQVLIRFAENAAMRCGFEPFAMPLPTTERMSKWARDVTRHIFREVGHEGLMQVERGAASIEQLLGPEVSHSIFARGLKRIAIEHTTSGAPLARKDIAA